MCGGNATPITLADNLRPLPRADDDDAALAAARDAWASGDHSRAIERSLTFGASPRAFSSPNGLGWVAAVGATPVIVSLDVGSAQLALEVPVVRLPQTKRVPAMRAALALCSETPVASRFCLRGDLLVARASAHVDLLSPALVRRLAREIAACAVKAQEQLTAAFDARPAIPEQGRDSSPDRAGRPLPLAQLAPPIFAAPASSGRASTRPPSPPSQPSSRQSTPGMFPAVQPRPITLRLTIPPSALSPDSDDDIPAILAPDLAEESSKPSSIAPPPSRQLEELPSSRSPAMLSPSPAEQAWGARGERAGALPPTLPSTSPAFIARAAPPPAASVVGGRPQSPEPPDAAPPSRRPARSASQDIGTPEGKLCELVRQALALATALSFEERPNTTLLLVRAAVFRAVHDHIVVLPSAVAFLYRTTRSVTREIWPTKLEPGKTGNISLPVAEPALGAFEQILTARAQVPKEKPAIIEPWVSAAQAKEHLARYVAEIELAPPDPMLRHYLALGALCELLVRAKLPQATDQRLRDIVAYAQRDGMKPHVIELMMTALRKIISG